MADTQNKRKFHDSGSAGVSYNSVPPPLNDFELAKQRAVQIAARLVAQDTKRSRVEDRSPDGSTAQHDEQTSEVHDSGQFFQSRGKEKSYNDVASGSFYNMHGPPESRKVEIPNVKVGLIIGKGGETIKYLQQQSGARIQITKDMDHNPNVPFRMAELMGTLEQINRAEQLIQDVIAEADAAAMNPSYAAHTSAGEQIQMSVPTNKVGLVIGRGGETIKSLQSRTGARIQLVPLLGPPEYHAGVAERVLTLVGSKQQVDEASELIKELISENRARGPSMHGGYNQAYRPPQGPPQWGPPNGPTMQQQSYGYQQGPYHTAPPQQYGSFPQQTHTAWQQPPPAPPQQFHPAGKYGYYNQQGQMGYTQQPHGGGYEQQASYVEYPPGASQEVYGQQVPGQPESYGQMGSQQIYGQPDMPPYGLPGVASTTFTQGPPQDSYGPPGVGEPGYGQQGSGQQLDSQQGPPGVGQPDYEYQQAHEARDLTQQGYGLVGSENEKQSSEYSYDRANETSYGHQEPSHSSYGRQLGPGQHDDGQGEQIAGQLNYGQPGTGYWNDSSAEYSYSNYDVNQASFGEQAPGQSGYGRQSGQPIYEQQQEGLKPPANLVYGGRESSQHVYSMHGASVPSSGYQRPGVTHPGQEHDYSQRNSAQEEYEREGPQSIQEQLKTVDDVAYGNGYSYNAQYESGRKGMAGNEGGDGQATTANARLMQAHIDEDQEPQS